MMSVRQFLFCVFIGPIILLFGVGALITLFPLMIPISYLLGSKHPVSDAWEICTVPPVDMFRAGWHGRLL